MHSLERTSGRYCLKELEWQGKMEALTQLVLLLSVVGRVAAIGGGFDRIDTDFSARSENADCDWDCLSRVLAQHCFTL